MKLAFKPFDDFIKANTTPKSRSRYNDSQIRNLDLSQPGIIQARVSGTKIYNVTIH